MYFSTHKFIVLFYFIKTQNSIVLNNNSNKYPPALNCPRLCRQYKKSLLEVEN